MSREGVQGMSFDSQMLEVEMEALRDLNSVSRDALIGGQATRAVGDGAPRSDVTDALGAVLDFKEHRRSDALDWAKGFVARFLTEIRAQICDSSKQGAAAEAGISPKAAASAVAAWIVGAFGIANPIAFGMATLVVLVLARSLQSTFCAMTVEEVKVGLASKT
jgi:hypothetical protein